MVAGDVEREPRGRRERRLGAPRGGGQQPLHVQPEPAPEGEQPVELLGLVAVAGDDERAAAPQPGVLAGRLGQLGAERGEAGGGAQIQVEQRVLAEVGLGDRGEHPRGDGPGARRAGVEHQHAQAALRGAPRAREPDRPAADDGDVRLALLVLHAALLLPYAGTTRIRFDGRRPGGALSARLRAPVEGERSVLDYERMTPRERVRATRLYLVCDARPRAFLDAALRGGVDIVQLRDKALGDDGLVAAAGAFRAAADAAGALFVLNDRPDLVGACGADGVHVGQDDGSVAAARAAVGPDRIVGRSTHAPAQGAAADADPEVDYLAVGPVHATPTKPGRPAAGLEYVEWAAAHVTTPWFAIGGIDPANVDAVTAAGARRIVVVRAIAGAADPEAAARTLRGRLEVPVGAAQR